MDGNRTQNRRGPWRTWAFAAAIAFAGCSQRPAPPQPPPSPRPDILLVSIDTLRADRVGQRLTPELHALAARGLRFTNARTTAPLTLPAHVSLMTGALPPAHGVRLNAQSFSGRLPAIAGLVSEAGYESAAFVGAYVLDRAFGLAKGFGTYDDRIRRDPRAALRLEAERPASEVADHAIAWLRAHAAASGKPLFTWVHFYDPHAPYTPPAEYLQRAGGQPYDGEIAHVDAQVGRLLVTLREIGREARTLVIVLGDHGESLGEHGERTHGMLLYDGALRIPLIVSGPGVPAGERREPVSVVDIAPTVLNRLGVPVPGSMAGVDLLGPGKPERDIYAETEYPLTAGWSALAALTDGRVKLIDAPDPELYDLDTDAAEARNTAGLRESAVNAMRSRLEQLRTAGPQAEAHQGIAPEVAERLRALGYVAGAPSPATGGRGANPASAIASWVRFEDALGMLATGDSRKALPVLTELATAHPDARVFRATQARALAEAGRPADALSRYRQLVARWPDDATLYHDLATTASAAGKADEARRAEQAALAIDPSYAAAWDGLGLLEASAGRAPEAKTAFQKAVEHDPTNAQFWTNLGNAARARGDTAGADRAYRQALSLDPALPDAANGLAVLFVEAGRPALAVPLLEDVTRRHPDFYEAWLNLGIACQQAGRIAEARAAYARVLAAPPRFARERSAAAQLARGLPRER